MNVRITYNNGIPNTNHKVVCYPHINQGFIQLVLEGTFSEHKKVSYINTSIIGHIYIDIEDKNKEIK